VSKLRFEVQDATSVAYPDSHFDALLDGWTFSIYEDKPEAAAEYKRISTDSAPFYAIQVREDSEYQDILDMFIPDEKLQEWTEEEDIDAQMKDLFGEPEVEKDLVTPYYFDSVDEAFDAYMFNFEEWLGMELSEPEQAELRGEIAKYERDRTVRIEEHAQFFKFHLNEE
jgi:ubiquinone/menaquinone biosynthesis C-methylase UbiE